MHTLKKTFLTLALALAFVSAEAAQNTGRILIPESKLKFKANEDYTEVTITGCTLEWSDYRSVDGKWLEIPSKIQGVPVTKIGDKAFDCKGSSSYKVGLWIPDCIKELGRAAFYCSDFISIRLPEGLKEIPGKGDYKGNYYDGCFEYCRAKSINIPSTVERIGDEAFCQSSLEEAVIPAGCKISTSAFARSNIKKLTFPKGRIYFDIYIDESIYYSSDSSINQLSYEFPFSDCNSLETIVIPKELDILYAMTLYSNSGRYYITGSIVYGDLKLSNFITGNKINDNFALQKQLKAVNVRDKYKVEGEEALALYNKAVSEKKWDQAKSIAQNAYNLFESFDYSGSTYYKEYNEWKERISDVNCILYDKAVSEKNWNQAKSIAQNTYNLFWNNNAEKEYEWKERISDVMCAQYFPALASKILKLDGAFVKKDGVLIYKIELTDDIYGYIYGYQGFILKDDSGEKVGTVSMNKFTELFKQKTGFEYRGSNNVLNYIDYIYRSATEAEIAAYNKNRKDAVKTFFDTITPNGSIVKSGNNLIFKINLPKDSYKYYREDGDYCFDFHAKDAEGKNQEFTESEFLDFVKEITGLEYEVSDRSSNPYIYRKATEAELTAYNKNRKDAVKTFINSITPTGSVVKGGSSLTFDIVLPNGSYSSYNYGTFYVNDASGKKQEFTKSEFLSLVKEITGFDYKTAQYNNGAYYIYRNATEAETAAYNQNRKDAVKTFIEKLTQSGNVVKSGNSLTFDIALPEGSYRNSGTFYANDAAGKNQSFTESEFLGLVKEITGFDYKTTKYNNGIYYIYRNATEAETAAYNQNRKDAVKTFIEKLTQSGNVTKSGNSLIFDIALPEGSYRNSGTFYANDAAGKNQSFTESEFLGLVKEITGFDYKTTKYNNGIYYIYRNATEAETAAYNQNRKDAVKAFIEKLTQSGNLVKDGSNFSFRIDFPNEAYTPDYGGTFYVKDAAGKKQSFGNTEFLNLVKEITGFDYKTNGYNHGILYIYRAATEEEILNNKKYAMRTFFNEISADGKLVKNGKKNVYTIPLPAGSYSEKNKIFSMIDVTGKTLEVPAKDFLAFTKEASTLTYSIGKNQDGTFYLFREPNREEKIGIAFNEGTLHTNLAAIKFEDKNGVVTIKGFTEKKTAFENAGLKAKDVVKKITVKTEDGEEKEISLADLAGLYPVPAKTVTFTVERTEKKSVQTLTFSAAVEWNEKELKKIK